MEKVGGVCAEKGWGGREQGRSRSLGLQQGTGLDEKIGDFCALPLKKALGWMGLVRAEVVWRDSDEHAAGEGGWGRRTFPLEPGCPHGEAPGVFPGTHGQGEHHQTNHGKVRDGLSRLQTLPG